jgi:hypothetical protein
MTVVRRCIDGTAYEVHRSDCIDATASSEVCILVTVKGGVESAVTRWRCGDCYHSMRSAAFGDSMEPEGQSA